MVDRDTDIDGGDLLEWLTGCGPVNPTMAGCEWKVHKSSSCSMRLDVSLVFSVCWNPEDVGSKPSEGMNLLARQEQTDKEQRLPFSVSFYSFQEKVRPR